MNNWNYLDLDEIWDIMVDGHLIFHLDDGLYDHLLLSFVYLGIVKNIFNPNTTYIYIYGTYAYILNFVCNILLTGKSILLLLLYVLLQIGRQTID